MHPRTVAPGVMAGCLPHLAPSRSRSGRGASTSAVPGPPQRTKPRHNLSRIGKQPVVIPSEVNVRFEGTHVVVKGPKGELEATLSPHVKLVRATPGPIRVLRIADTKEAAAHHGLARSLLNNMVVGCSKGYAKVMKLVGVGYVAELLPADEEHPLRRLSLLVGYCHPVVLEIPDLIACEVREEGTEVELRCHDKQLLGYFAAKVRESRPPEPYKGRGIRYSDEVIRLKSGKKGR